MADVQETTRPRPSPSPSPIFNLLDSTGAFATLNPSPAQAPPPCAKARTPEPPPTPRIGPPKEPENSPAPETEQEHTHQRHQRKHRDQHSLHHPGHPAPPRNSSGIPRAQHRHESAVISLLSDSSPPTSEVGDGDSDSGSDVVITHATSLYAPPPPPAPSPTKHTPQHAPFPVPKRHRRHSAFKTGPWSYKDRMRFVGSLQRGIDFIALGQEMRRDVDDVFEKFSDVVAAGLYQCKVKDCGTQTDVDGVE